LTIELTFVSLKTISGSISHVYHTPPSVQRFYSANTPTSRRTFNE